LGAPDDAGSFQTRNKFVQQEIFARPHSFCARPATFASALRAKAISAEKIGNISVIWGFIAEN
jgi:hypothetical protein